MQNKNNEKATHSFAARPMIFNLDNKFQNSIKSAWIGALQNGPGNKLFELIKSKL